jgi:hypothetical protein
VGDYVNPSIVIALAGLFITVSGALIVLIWRAGVMLGRLESRLAHVEEKSGKAHSYISELRGKLDSTHDVAVRAELKSSHDWSDK